MSTCIIPTLIHMKLSLTAQCCFNAVLILHKAVQPNQVCIFTTGEQCNCVYIVYIYNYICAEILQTKLFIWHDVICYSSLHFYSVSIILSSLSNVQQNRLPFFDESFFFFKNIIWTIHINYPYFLKTVEIIIKLLLRIIV